MSKSGIISIVRTRHLAIAAISAIAAWLALGGARPAEADVASFEVTPQIALSGSTFTATLVTDGGPEDVFIAIGHGVIPTDVQEQCVLDETEDECIAGGQDCDPDLDFSLGNPEFCRQWAAAGQADGGTPPFRVTLTFTAGCEGETFDSFVAAGSTESLTDWLVPDITCVDQDGVLLIRKDFDGDPAQTFEFTYSGDSCVLGIGGSHLGFASSHNFALANGETAILICDAGTHTVTETPVAGVALADIDCGETDAEEDLETGSVSLTVTVEEVGEDSFWSGFGDCTFVNRVTEDLPDITVVKQCVGEFEATFELTVGEETRPLECGAIELFADLEPGTYTVTEHIQGGDEPGFGTTIMCDDTGEKENGTTRDVILGEENVMCVIVNGIGVEDLLGPSGDEVDDVGNANTNTNVIDLDNANANTNVIGLDNANRNTNANNNENENENENENTNVNNNVNTNTQDQENEQDQDNKNKQTNNIEASPEINIDLD